MNVWMSTTYYAKAPQQDGERRLAEALMAFTAKGAEFGATTGLLYERYTAATEAERTRRERHR